MNTPETDKLEYEQECNYEVAWEDHCRRFETERNEARKQRDELLAALESCKEDSIDLLSERDWWKNELRLSYQIEYNKILSNIRLADKAIANVKGETA